MNRYSSYKDSGEKWLGEIPSHWEIMPLKRTVRLLDSKRKKQGNELPIALENIESWTGHYIPTDSEYDSIGVAFKKGDILFGKLRPYLAKVYLAKENGIALGDFFTLRAIKVYNKYIFYFLLSKGYIDFVDSSTYGTKMPRTNWLFMGSNNIPVPPISEQQAIASYLDTATSKIDAAIVREQKMIDLLNERKQIIINNAVTKGLNPNAKLKDSGVDWIGEIPEDWEVIRLKYLLAQPLKYGANEAADSDNPSWPRYIRITDIDESGNLKDDTFRSLAPEKAANYLLEKGDILFARSGATVGKTFLFNSNIMACHAGYLIKAQCDSNKIIPEYLYYYTKSGAYDNWKNNIFIQATIQNIGADKYSMLNVVVPPIKDQKMILDWLSNQIPLLDKPIEASKKTIELLQERKQIIINDVVTGKIKVC